MQIYIYIGSDGTNYWLGRVRIGRIYVPCSSVTTEVWILMTNMGNSINWIHSAMAANIQWTPWSTIQLYKKVYIHISENSKASWQAAGLSLVFFLLIYFNFPKLASLWDYCDNVFVILLVHFSYEDKHLTQHWTLIIHWPVVCMTQNVHMCWRQTC